MIVSKNNKPDKPDKPGKLEIDLTGPNGNVFVLMGYAKRLARQFDLNGNAIVEQMMSGDYEDAVQTFEEYFGEYVILYR